MFGIPEVDVTSPTVKWKGTDVRHDGLIAVLFGLDRDRPEGASEHSFAHEEIRVILFERVGGTWFPVPVEKLGTANYKVNEVLTFNWLNQVADFATDEEQLAYLMELGVAIDGEFVELEVRS